MAADSGEREHYMKKNKPNAERLLSFLFLLITLGVVLYVGFSGNDLEALGGACVP